MTNTMRDRGAADSVSLTVACTCQYHVMCMVLEIVIQALVRSVEEANIVCNTFLNQGNQGGNVISQSGADATSTAGQEVERGVAGGDTGSSVPGVSLQGDSQTGLRRLAGSAWPSSPTGPSPAVTAFEAAKDIMEALRTKHTNLANELEVQYLDNV